MASVSAKTSASGSETRSGDGREAAPDTDRQATDEHSIQRLALVPHRLTAQERHLRICELAYRRAQQRGFAPGNEVEDWLEAEREVDAGRY
jgi:hypothetical protein